QAQTLSDLAGRAGSLPPDAAAVAAAQQGLMAAGKRPSIGDLAGVGGGGKKGGRRRGGGGGEEGGGGAKTEPESPAEDTTEDYSSSDQYERTGIEVLQRRNLPITVNEPSHHTHPAA